KTDPDTNKPESGEVRFYASDGVNNASGNQCIGPYDLTSHASVNLVSGGIYGAPGRSVAAWWFDAALGPVNASGSANAAEWLTANSKKNPLNPTAPHSPSFLA